MLSIAAFSSTGRLVVSFSLGSYMFRFSCSIFSEVSNFFFPVASIVVFFLLLLVSSRLLRPFSAFSVASSWDWSQPVLAAGLYVFMYFAVVFWIVSTLCKFDLEVRLPQLSAPYSNVLLIHPTCSSVCIFASHPHLNLSIVLSSIIMAFASSMTFLTWCPKFSPLSILIPITSLYSITLHQILMLGPVTESCGIPDISFFFFRMPLSNSAKSFSIWQKHIKPEFYSSWDSLWN